MDDREEPKPTDKQSTKKMLGSFFLTNKEGKLHKFTVE